ncbi:hypothetical protein SDC9_95140 [bioreactor metagenome]|uniref:Uncharacterized protein n=1 Tax=bioreactor metagenome TaxID=1076179 RepID=A0A645A5F3_9ZZZZ
MELKEALLDTPFALVIGSTVVYLSVKSALMTLMFIHPREVYLSILSYVMPVESLVCSVKSYTV